MSALILAVILALVPQAGASVTANDLVISLSANLKARPSLSSAEVRQDLDLLKLALTRGYAGPDFVRQLDKMVADAKNSQTLCDGLAKIFAGVRDAHLKAALEFKTCGARPESGRVGSNLGKESWLLKTVEYQGGETYVLAVPAFWPKYDSRWKGFLETVRALRAKKQPFILDFRGNSGGDDTMGFELARVLLGMPEHVNLPTPVESRTFLQTAEAFAIQSNHWAWSILRLKRANKPVPEYMTQRRDEILSWVERANNGQFPEEYIEPLPEQSLDEKQIFQNQVYILIDRACASACETTMQVLEKLPQRILVGENTYGAVAFGGVGPIVLPNSKVSVSLSTMSVQFRDHRQVEKTGYKPDIVVPEGSDALDAALEAIH